MKTIYFGVRVGCLLVSGLGAQTITQSLPPAPASLSVFAGEGDLTYCISALVKSAPGFTLTCRKSGATYFTASVIKSSGVISNGDITWVFNWDLQNPKLVHVQASGNVRDPLVLSAWMNFGTVVQDFQIGELVHDASGTKTATVTHWTHTTGTFLVDGILQANYGAQIALGSLNGPVFVVGDVVTGSVSGAAGTIGQIFPVTSNKMKTAFDVEWPAAAPASLLSRMVRAVGKVF